MRSVITNGFPKTGNHALVRACELLAIPAQVRHDSYDDIVLIEGGFDDYGQIKTGSITRKRIELEDEPNVIHIRRDPRNILVSWLRMERKPVTQGTFLAAFRKFQLGSLIEDMATFEPWLDRAGLNVSYEDLIASDKEMRRIAEFAGVPYIDGSWEDLPATTNTTYTWNADHSDYRTVWTPLVRDGWNSEGGKELLERWGY